MHMFVYNLCNLGGLELEDQSVVPISSCFGFHRDKVAQAASVVPRVKYRGVDTCLWFIKDQKRKDKS